MGDGQTEAQQQQDADKFEFSLEHPGPCPYLTVVELSALGTFRRDHISEMKFHDMVRTLGTSSQKLRGAIDQSTKLQYDAASGTVSLKGESDG